MIKKIIVIGSGKGGVGKSTVSVNLAVSLAKKKLKIGLLDADIYGPSIPRMLGITKKPNASKEKKILPYEKYGIKSMSIGNMIPDNSAIIWRGAMATSAIRQLYNDVEWGDLDYLLLDLPPGTGDIQLSICQSFNVNGALIVSTPQEISLIDVRKAISMFNKVNVPIIGLVQNMSYLKIDGKKQFIFGNDGVNKEAKKQSLNFLGEIPIIPDIAKSSDEGLPMSLNDKNEVSEVFQNLAEHTLRSIKNIKIKEVKIS